MIHAVCVGIDKYDDSAILPLCYARADAEAVHRLLTSVFDETEVKAQLLVDSSASKLNVLEAVGEYLPRVTRSGDVVVLYFAGHGSPECSSSPDQTSRYLILNDTRYDSIFATGIDVERELTRLLERICGPSLIVCFLDSCFSGRAGGRTFEGPCLAYARTRDTRIKLKDLELGEGRLIMTACDDDQLAFEDSSIGHGVFTLSLLEALSRDRNGKRSVTITCLYDEIDEAVRIRTGGKQTPILNGRAKSARLPVFSQ